MRNEPFFIDDVLKDRPGPPPEELKIVRGIMFALPIALILWALIAGVAYWAYRAIA